MTMFPTEGRVEPARSITLPGIKPKAKQYLEQHGCTIAEEKGLVLVIYSEGTTKREMYPRTAYERYRVHLPDGTELREAHALLREGESYLYLLEDPNVSK